MQSSGALVVETGSSNINQVTEKVRWIWRGTVAFLLSLCCLVRERVAVCGRVAWPGAVAGGWRLLD